MTGQQKHTGAESTCCWYAALCRDWHVIAKPKARSIRCLGACPAVLEACFYVAGKRMGVGVFC